MLLTQWAIMTSDLVQLCFAVELSIKAFDHCYRLETIVVLFPCKIIEIACYELSVKKLDLLAFSLL